MNIRQEKILVAIIVSFLIIIFTNLDYVSQILEKEYYPIDFCESVERNYGATIVELEKKHIGIPEYHTTIYIEPLKKEVLINSYAELNLRIIDEGYFQLKKPYFYILLLNPKDELVGVSPCFCGQEKIILNKNLNCRNINSGPYCYFEGRFTQGAKFSPWPKGLKWNEGSKKGMSCHEPENHFCTQKELNICISRNSFLQGSIEGHKFVYRYKVDEAGTWKAYVFLFDEEYETLKYGNVNIDSEILENAVGFAETNFEVAYAEPEQKSFGYFSRVVISVLGSILTYLFVIMPYYERIKKWVISQKRKILRFSILIIFIIVVCKITSKLIY